MSGEPRAASELSGYSQEGGEPRPFDERVLSRFFKPFQPGLDDLDTYVQVRAKQARFLHGKGIVPEDAESQLIEQAQLLNAAHQAFPDDPGAQLEQMTATYGLELIEASTNEKYTATTRLQV